MRQKWSALGAVFLKREPRVLSPWEKKKKSPNGRLSSEAFNRLVFLSLATKPTHIEATRSLTHCFLELHQKEKKNNQWIAEFSCSLVVLRMHKEGDRGQERGMNK